MKLITIYFCLLFSLSATELSYEKLIKIVDSLKTTELTLKELEIYPKASKYNCSIEIHNLEKNESADIEKTAVAQQKIIDGKYIVITVTLPKNHGQFHYIITFDKQSQTYIKWRFSKQSKEVNRFIGLAEIKSKTIQWTIKPQNGVVWVTFDKFTEKQIHFVEIVYKDGTAVTRFEGKMKKG